MTANQVKGKGFGGALDYNLEKVTQGVAELLDHNFASSDRKTILYEVAVMKAERPGLQKFFYHTSINFPPKENLTNDRMKQIAKDYLDMSGFRNNQYIIFRHHDANHPHLHILVNRIGYDGTVVSDSNDYVRSEKVLRQLEIKYNLQQVTPSRQARQRAVTKDELEKMKRTNQPSDKLKLQTLIKEALKTNCPGEKPTTKEFIKLLELKGVSVKFNQATTGYVSGISYKYEGFVTTGAKLGNAYKWSSIKNSIDYNQERDSKIIGQTNQQQSESIKLTPYQSFANAELWKDTFEETIHPKNHHVLDDLLESRQYDQNEQFNLARKKKKKKKKGRSRGVRM